MTTLSPHSSHLMKSHSRASSDKKCKTFMISGITYEKGETRLSVSNEGTLFSCSFVSCDWILPCLRISRLAQKQEHWSQCSPRGLLAI